MKAPAGQIAPTGVTTSQRQQTARDWLLGRPAAHLVDPIAQNLRPLGMPHDVAHEGAAL